MLYLYRNEVILSSSASFTLKALYGSVDNCGSELVFTEFIFSRMTLIDKIQGNVADSSLPKYKDQNYDKVTYW